MKMNFKKISASFIGAALIGLLMSPAIAEDIEIYVGNEGVDIEVKPNLIFIIDTSGSMSATVVSPLPYDINVDYKATYGSDACFDSDKVYFSTGDTPKDCSTDDYFDKTAINCEASELSMFNTTAPTVVVDTPVLISDITTVNDPEDLEGINLRNLTSTYDPVTQKTVAVDEQVEVKINGVNTRTIITHITTTTTGPALGSGWYQDRIAQWEENSTYPEREEWIAINNAQKDWNIECKADSGVHGKDDADTDKYIANYVEGPYTDSESKSVDWNTVGRGYVMYTANYLNWTKVAPNDPSPPDRLDVVKDVTYSVVDSSNNINIGLMRFDSSSTQGGYEGGSVRYPVLDVTASRNDFKSRLKTFTHKGYTPLAETLYENYLYWAGKDVLYGNKASPTNSTGVAVDGSGNKTYESPIKYSCQKNYNIYLSDGAATRDTSADSLIKALPGVDTCTDPSGSNCLNELAEFMHTNDVYDGMDGEQTVTTYTVGFDIDHALLRATAEQSGGKYYRANNAAELTQIFNKIIAEILSVNTTFSAPAVSINAFNRTTHRNELYFTLFKPAIGPHWNGNLKRFKLVFDADGVPAIRDYKDDFAINPITGFFDDGAYSWWTDTSGSPDGGEVAKGGAAAHVGDGGVDRTVYTYTGASAPVNVDLSTAANKFHESNVLITNTMLNITGTDAPSFRTTVIKWARGLDAFDDNGDGSTDDPRKYMGDPLHSEPALIQYGGTDAVPDITAYVGTNDGVLHAINTIDGTELFSFIPQELLGLQRVVASDVAGDKKAYGIDGSIQSLVIDNNKDGYISTGDGDRVYIFFGERRGGNHYYAMDVSDRKKPVLMWVIEGGTGDFKRLGQTWSNIQIKKVKIGTDEKYVAVFAGGYDLDQDDATIRTTDDHPTTGFGNAVYMVDAIGTGSSHTGAGKRLWWASSDSGADLVLSEMKYSIPSRLKAVDVSGGGYLDRIYVGDMGGQIWRFDFENGEDLNDFASGGRLADLATDSSTANNRRFFYPPDVAFVSEPGKAPYLALAFSSGYRAHPLKRDNVDRIYMLKDMHLFDPPKNITGDVTYPDASTESDFFDATDNTLGEGSDSEKAIAISELDSKDGWYITLKEPSGGFIGEKGLSEALIIEGLMVVTTYIPQDRTSTSACEPADGVGRVYFMNLGDATPTYNFDKTVDSTENLTVQDRFNTKVGGGLPPGAVPIFTKDGSAIIVGTETVENPIDDAPKRMFWYEQ